MKVQLSLRADLARKTKVNAFAVVSVLNHHDLKLVRNGRTETIKKCPCVSWTTKFKLDYDPDSMPLLINVSVFDERKGDKGDFLLGEAVFYMTEILKLDTKEMTMDVDESMRIHALVDQSCRGMAAGWNLNLHLRGLGFSNVDPGYFGLGATDPFFEISKAHINEMTQEKSWIVVYRSEHVRNNLNPVWNPAIMLDLEKICYGDLNWPLKITVYDWEKNRNHGILGSVDTTINDILEHQSTSGNADRKTSLMLVHKGKVRGLLVVVKSEIKKDGTSEKWQYAQ